MTPSGVRSGKPWTLWLVLGAGLFLVVPRASASCGDYVRSSPQTPAPGGSASVAIGHETLSPSPADTLPCQGPHCAAKPTPPREVPTPPPPSPNPEQWGQLNDALLPVGVDLAAGCHTTPLLNPLRNPFRVERPPRLACPCAL